MFSIITAIIFLILNESPVQQQAELFFRDKLNGYDNFKIELLNLPENAVSIKFLTEEFDKTKSIITMPADIKFRDGSSSKKYLSIKIQLFKTVLTANQNISRDKRLRLDYFISKSIQVNDLKRTPVFSIDEIENCSAKFRINRGEILFKEDLQKIPVVTAGKRITASLFCESTVISFPAFARQDGGIDDLIRIITEDKKLFKARVLDSLNVSIVE